MQIRSVRPDGAAAIQDTYLPIIRDTAISLQQDPQAVDEVLERIVLPAHLVRWLVGLDGERTV